MKKQVKQFLNFKPLSVSPTRRQLLLSGLALVLLGSKSHTAEAESGGMLR
ncbi:MAG: N-acetylmuramoyl-L-alanine amidase AmiA, partial [Serratia proteamaculans]